MAGRTIPTNRSRTSLDQERENFEKNQTLAINKAINEIEVPVKAKHARSTIIGTFQEKGCHTFWSIILRMPIQGNPIIAWKFCHTLHKILREGHPQVLKDSYRHREFLVDNGKLWGHLKEGYGKLIFLYCRLLVVKLDFHRRNPRFPGNLLIKDEELELICENDVNSYFQLSVELLDYMDEILGLQSAVFGSLDMSRSNSMTNAGQCRLAPLIACIQDSSQIYDYIVKLLFKLHNCLPPDTLEGHRIRFLKQFRALRQFYLQSSTLQYFKSLIQVPYLDENPPNFLVSSELSRHVTPVVILPAEPTPPPDDVSLVDFAEETSERNGSSSPDLLAERDRYIEHLLHQIEQLSAEVKKIRQDCQRQIGDFREAIQELELRLSEKESELEEALKGKEDIERKLSEAAQSAQLGSVVQLQLQETEKKAKAWEEKFSKMKEVYQKLRDEHIALLRQKADADKKLSVANAALEQSNKIHSELQDSLELAKENANEAHTELNNFKTIHEEKAQQLVSENNQLGSSVTELKDALSNAEQEIEQNKTIIIDLQKEKESLSIHLEQSTNVLEESTKNAQELQITIEQFRASAQATNDEFAAFKVEQEIKIQEMLKEKEEIVSARNQIQETVNDLQQDALKMTAQLANLQQEKEDLILQLNDSKVTLEQCNKTELDLRESLEQTLTSVKCKEEELNAFTVDKEAIILDITNEKNELERGKEELEGKLQDLEQKMVLIDSERANIQQEKDELLINLSDLKAIQENNKKTQEELRELLDQAKVNNSIKEEELNALKIEKEAIILGLTEEKENLGTSNDKLKEHITNLEQQLNLASMERDEAQRGKAQLGDQMEAQIAQHNSVLSAIKLQTIKLLQALLVDCAAKSEQYLDKCIVDLSKSPVVAMTIQDQSGISTQGALSLLDMLRNSLYTYLNDQNEEAVCRVIPLIFPFTQAVGYALLQGQQLAHSLPDIEKADKVVAKCVTAGKTTVLLHQALQNEFTNDTVGTISNQVSSALQELDSLSEALIEAMKASADKENVGEELENELGAMERAIEEAAARIAKLWDNSKRSQTGLKLEVNEKVLDSCTALMKAIIELIRKAKFLQEEIVARGKGSATAKDFYKRNHRWTEGLLSAAKAVGFGAKLLTDAADKVVQGQAKFEQLTVASQEIAASTAQLVFASRVKAELQSKNLQALAEASKAVSSATGGVVATAKHCAELVEDSTVMDFSNLTLHQAKRLEMESQVKVLEFESSLEKERLRLSALRRQHYQLAGETDA